MARCSQTTLLKTLLGLLAAKSGEVKLADRPLKRYSIRERARLLAYVPQSHVSTFAFTRRPRDRCANARALWRRAHLRERPYTMISGGERQLVLLARALAQEPRFVVLDEPTANLDFGNQGKVMHEIRRLAASGHGVLFTTHDPNHAMGAADRVYLLRGGECIGQGPTSTMLDRAQLEALYGGPVEEISDRSDGRIAFLPG